MLIKGLEHLKWHMEAESWGCPALKREGSGQNFIKVFKYLMGRSKEDAARLFSVVPSEKKSGSNSGTGCKVCILADIQNVTRHHLE